MENRKSEAAENLALINRMIEQTRNRIVRNSGRPMLVWGYSTLATLCITYLASLRFDAQTYKYLWLLLPLFGLVFMRLTRPKRIEGEARTLIDRVIGEIWIINGATAVLISLWGIFGTIRIPIVFTILLIMGMGIAATGRIIRFAPAVFGGGAGILCAAASLAAEEAATAPILFAAGFVFMTIIPGHILNRRSNHLQKRQTKGAA